MGTPTSKSCSFDGTTGGTTATIPSASYGGNHLILVWTATVVAAGLTAPKSVPSGLGATWTEVADQQTGGGAQRFRLTCYRTTLATPQTGAITLTHTAVDHVKWSVVEYDDASTVVQSASNAGATVANITATLAAFANAANGVAASTFHAGTAVVTAGSGFTELAEENTTRTIETMWRADNDTTADSSWTGNQHCAIIAAEIAPEPTAPASVVLDATYYSNAPKLAGAVATATVTAAIGDTLIVVASGDNRGGATEGLPAGAITDSASHTWSRLGYQKSTASANTACEVAVYGTEVTTAMSGGTVTLTAHADCIAKSFHVWRFRGPSTTVRAASVGAEGTSTTPSVTHTGPVNTDLVIGAVAFEGPLGDSVTADADTTNGTWSAVTKHGTSEGTVVSNVAHAAQWKAVTATSSQTFNPTITSRDWEAVIVALRVNFESSGPPPSKQRVMGFVPGANDYTLTTDFIIVADTGTLQQRLVWRAQSSGAMYVVEHDTVGNQISVYYQDASGTRFLVTTAAALTTVATDVVHLKVSAVGSAHKVRWWLNAAGEPGTWNVEFTDANLANGYVGLGAASNSLASFDFDNFLCAL